MDGNQVLPLASYRPEWWAHPARWHNGRQVSYCANTDAISPLPAARLTRSGRPAGSFFRRLLVRLPSMCLHKWKQARLLFTLAVKFCQQLRPLAPDLTLAQNQSILVGLSKRDGRPIDAANLSASSIHLSVQVERPTRVGVRVELRAERSSWMEVKFRTGAPAWTGGSSPLWPKQANAAPFSGENNSKLINQSIKRPLRRVGLDKQASHSLSHLRAPPG